MVLSLLVLAVLHFVFVYVLSSDCCDDNMLFFAKRKKLDAAAAAMTGKLDHIVRGLLQKEREQKEREQKEREQKKRADVAGADNNCEGDGMLLWRLLEEDLMRENEQAAAERK